MWQPTILIGQKLTILKFLEKMGVSNHLDSKIFSIYFILTNRISGSPIWLLKMVVNFDDIGGKFYYCVKDYSNSTMPWGGFSRQHC